MESINISASIIVLDANVEEQTMQLECVFTPQFDDDDNPTPIFAELNCRPDVYEGQKCASMSVDIKNEELDKEQRKQFIHDAAPVFIEAARTAARYLSEQIANVLDVINVRIRHYNDDTAEVVEHCGVIAVSDLARDLRKMH